MSDADAIRTLELQLSAAEQRATEREARIAALERDLERLRADKMKLLLALGQTEASA